MALTRRAHAGGGQFPLLPPLSLIFSIFHFAFLFGVTGREIGIAQRRRPKAYYFGWRLLFIFWMSPLLCHFRHPQSRDYGRKKGWREKEDGLVQLTNNVCLLESTVFRASISVDPFGRHSFVIWNCFAYCYCYYIQIANSFSSLFAKSVSVDDGYWPFFSSFRTIEFESAAVVSETYAAAASLARLLAVIAGGILSGDNSATISLLPSLAYTHTHNHSRNTAPFFAPPHPRP